MEERRNLVKEEVGGMVGGEFLNSVEGDLGGIVQIVDDDDLVAAEEELQNGVTADVAGATSHKNGRHFCFCFEFDFGGDEGEEESERKSKGDIYTSQNQNQH